MRHGPIVRTAARTALVVGTVLTAINQGEIELLNSGALGAANGTAAAGTTVAGLASLALDPGLAVGNEALVLNGVQVILRAAEQ